MDIELLSNLSKSYTFTMDWGMLVKLHDAHLWQSFMFILKVFFNKQNSLLHTKLAVHKSKTTLFLKG